MSTLIPVLIDNRPMLMEAAEVAVLLACPVIQHDGVPYRVIRFASNLTRVPHGARDGVPRYTVSVRIETCSL